MTYALCILLGAVLLKFGSDLKIVISDRLNYGKEVHCDRRLIGHTVSCRFNGEKKYFFVDRYATIYTQEAFSDRKSAAQACINKYQEGRPKHSVFARVV